MDPGVRFSNSMKQSTLFIYYIYLDIVANSMRGIKIAIFKMGSLGVDMEKHRVEMAVMMMISGSDGRTTKG